MNIIQQLAEGIIDAEGKTEEAIDSLAEMMAQMQDEEHYFNLSDEEYEHVLKEAKETLEKAKDEAEQRAKEMAEEASIDLYDKVKDMAGEY